MEAAAGVRVRVLAPLGGPRRGCGLWWRGPARSRAFFSRSCWRAGWTGRDSGSALCRRRCCFDRGLPVARRQGNSEGLLLALALAACCSPCDGRSRWAVVCFVGCALLRVEAWPFLVVLAVWHGWRWRLVSVSGGRAGALVRAGVAGVGRAAAIGRSRAGPEPGAAGAGRRAGAGVAGRRVPLLFWPLVVGAVFASRRAPGRRRVDRAVALMAQAGFSGEWRYAVPGAAAMAIAGGRRAGGAAAAGGRAGGAGAGARRGAGGRPAGPARTRASLGRSSRPTCAARSPTGEGARRCCAAGGRTWAATAGRCWPTRFASRSGASRPTTASRRGVVFRSLTDADAAPAPAAPTHFRPVACEGRWTVLWTCEG